MERRNETNWSESERRRSVDLNLERIEQFSVEMKY